NHRDAGRAVEAPHPPALADPDVRLVGSMTGTTLGGIFPVPSRLKGHWVVKFLDAQVALEGEGGPRNETGERMRCLGHEQTLATGQTAVFPPTVEARRTGSPRRVVTPLDSSHRRFRGRPRTRYMSFKTARSRDLRSFIHRPTAPSTRGFT